MSRLQERIENFNRAYGIFTDAVQAYKSDTNCSAYANGINTVV